MSNSLAILKPYLACYIFILGLVVGSFLNVVALRGLSGEDFVFSRSKCPKCSNQLAWYMNIPLLSYIFLRGKCAFCKTKISIQYPIVELVCGLLFLFSYLKFDFNLNFVFALIIVCFGIILSITDFLEKVIIAQHTYILAIIGLIFSIINHNFLSCFIGGIIGFLFFEIISFISKKLISIRAFGEGDSLIALAFGCCFGYKKILLIIALSLILQVVFSLPILIYQNLKLKKLKLALSYLYIIISLVLVTLFNLKICFLPIKFINIFPVIISLGLIYCLKIVMNEIKTKKEEFEKLDNDVDLYDKTNPFNLFPFGPALVFASIIVLYFSTFFSNLISY